MKEYLARITIGDFKGSLGNEIDIDLLKEKWSHLWYISFSKFGEEPEYKLVKLPRKDSEIKDFRTTISKKQAMDIVEQLNLTYHQSFIFRNAGHYDNVKNT